MTHGLVLGKFLPPHNGHRYLLEFARRFAERLTVVVGTLESEPIPGELRYRWVQELYPDCRVLHLTEENPQYPDEHPDFWNIWKASLQGIVGEPIDYLFASEDYGQKLAETLSATFVPTNGMRELVPISGSAIRDYPLMYWEHIPSLVRPYFLKRVCLFGPESTGKSTLALRLAQFYKTLVVPEYARIHLERKQADYTYDDVPVIARGQWASEEALARIANKVMFSDTDVLTSAIWSDWMFRKVPDGVEELIEQQRYHLYLLNDIDVPWEEDPIRYLPHQRKAFLERCRTELENRGRPYVFITGGWQARFESARQAVDKVLTQRSSTLTG